MSFNNKLIKLLKTDRRFLDENDELIVAATNQLYGNLSEIDDEQFKVSDEGKRLNRSFYEE